MMALSLKPILTINGFFLYYQTNKSTINRFEVNI